MGYPNKEISDEPLENFEISKVHLGLNFNPKKDVGFEPTRRFTDLTVFKTVPFSRTWVIFHEEVTILTD